MILSRWVDSYNSNSVTDFFDGLSPSSSVADIRVADSQRISPSELISTVCDVRGVIKPVFDSKNTTAQGQSTFQKRARSLAQSKQQ